jgi:hypothetical protein
MHATGSAAGHDASSWCERQCIGSCSAAVRKRIAPVTIKVKEARWGASPSAIAGLAATEAVAGRSAAFGPEVTVGSTAFWSKP